ncbi:protein of unknown function [Xenorhabdus poinarii G6]|uniref:Uncharacterized protein n=1 Tax=Xenorhabdus poinarii G6 TaxID=1354304 RepID=A0A068R6N6_9GAMM|nr:protein of unknown function [Xenorhabdus poinarii G6]
MRLLAVLVRLDTESKVPISVALDDPAIDIFKTIAPADVAEQFWNMYITRQTHAVIFGSTIPVSEIVVNE